MSREKRLGRGLEALLGKVAAVESQAEQVLDREQENREQENRELGKPAPEYSLFNKDLPSVGVEQTDHAEQALQQAMQDRKPNTIDIMRIDRNPYQPRLDFDPAELDALASSLNTHGLLQPIVVRPVGDRFQIIAGERRFRAATRAGWSEVPVHILSVGDREMAELALTENLQRKDLNALEKATAFANYLEVYGGTHEELAARLELDRSTVTNLLRLLDLPEEIQTLVRKEQLSQGHARCLLALKEWEQMEIVRRILNEGWSVRQTERFVKELLESTKQGGVRGIVDSEGNRKEIKPENPHLEQLEQEFRHRLGTKVQLTHNEKGKGKLVIPFSSHEEFKRIHQWICRGTKMKDAG